MTMTNATLVISSSMSVQDSPLRITPVTSLLKYDNIDDNFLWDGEFSELKDFLDELLDIPAGAEVNSDKTHNATTYKKNEYTVRFYHTTKKLKLYGTGGPGLMRLLHEH